MTKRLKIALAQLNPVLGDSAGNAALLRAARKQAATEGADIVVASELFLCGYPPEDLVLKASFVRHIREVALALVAETAEPGPALIFGLPYMETAQDPQMKEQKGAPAETQLYNSVMVAQNGTYEIRHKVHLPNYSVFDEKRLFAAGPLPAPVHVCGVEIGLPICEDIWFSDVCQHLRAQGAELFVCINGSPFERGKYEERRHHASQCCADTQLAMLYVNQLGGQDELVFDGASFIIHPDGQVPLQMADWEAGLVVADMAQTAKGWRCVSEQQAVLQTGLASVYQAAMLGLRDYVEKNNFPGILLGLSGGIDSALCAALGADALGPERVQAFLLPSQYTAASSFADARLCAKRLGIKFNELPITDIVAALEKMLTPAFADTQMGDIKDITAQNIQSRLRGLLLMALSNQSGSMLVTTGNKSEVSVGYATLYGDMNGGYNPVKDIYKTEIFGLAKWRNENHPKGALAPAGEVIPPSIIEKPPTAELKEGQKDEDNLPPYKVLDDILMGLVEEELDFATIIERGHKPEIVKQVEHLLYISEYKRRQAAPGVKIGSRNFGLDRRYPITNGFREARLKDES